jgi:type IV pilus assembly protein PilQ
MVQDKSMKTVSLTWRGRWSVALLLLGLAAGFVGAAQPKPAAVDPAAAMNGQKIDPNQAQVDPTSGLIKFIAFQKDMNIRDSLRLLAALCKKNIVPSAGVEGPLTISRLYNVTFEKALEAVLGNSFKYEQDGDFVRVYTAEEYKKIKEDPARMQYKVITLYYITAEEAVKLLQPVLSGAPSAKITATSPAQKNISGSSGSSGSGGLSSSGGGNDPANHDMIIVFDYPECIEKVESVIRSVDVRPRQVLIEATIMSVQLTEDNKFGVDWNLLSGIQVDRDRIVQGGGYGTHAQTLGFSENGGGTGLTVGFAAGNVRAVITALEQITDATVLANPKILAVNKQEGQLLIGKKIGYEDTATTTQTGGTTASTAFLETGTRLAFRPYIGDDGYIRMDIYPKDSTGDLQQNGKPFERTTELRTNVMVKDGQTVVIGGLFRDSVNVTKSQVPVLGSLPIVGALFRGKLDKVARDEVIIILTPHIIVEPSEVHGDKRVEDIRLKRDAATDSLSVIDAARIAEEAYAEASKFYLEGDLEKALFHLKIALMSRPTYLEALRLRERIIAETDPEQFKRLDSITTREVSKQEAEGWSRR